MNRRTGNSNAQLQHNSHYHHGNDSHFVHQLSEAEKRGRELVDNARRRRVLILRKAKDEANREIELFKSECDKRIDEMRSSIEHTKDDIVHRIDHEHTEKIDELNRLYELNAPNVIHFIIDTVVDAKPVINKNLRLQLEMERREAESMGRPKQVDFS